MLKKLIITLIILLTFLTGANASDNYIPVRVGISNNNFSAYIFDSIEFNNANTLRVMDSSTGYTVPVTDESNTIKVTSEDNSGFMLMMN